MEVDKRLVAQAKEVIDKIFYLTLATSNKKGEPWNSPVYTAFDKSYNFYWASWTKNQHSRNIREKAKVFAVIYDSTTSEGTGFGVYLQGKAQQLGSKDIVEIISALKFYNLRKNKKTRTLKEFVGVSPLRMYKFTPQRVWVNGNGTVRGKFVDTRIEITKGLLRK